MWMARGSCTSIFGTQVFLLSERWDSGGIRLCPHIYNTVEEIDRAVDAVASLKDIQTSLSLGI